jgi:hypothetical protein
MVNILQEQQIDRFRMGGKVPARPGSMRSLRRRLIDGLNCIPSSSKEKLLGMKLTVLVFDVNPKA